MSFMGSLHNEKWCIYHIHITSRCNHSCALWSLHLFLSLPVGPPIVTGPFNHFLEFWKKMANYNTESIVLQTVAWIKDWMDSAVLVLEALPKGSLCQRSLHWAIPSRKNSQRILSCCFWSSFPKKPDSSLRSYEEVCESQWNYIGVNI